MCPFGRSENFFYLFRKNLANRQKVQCHIILGKLNKYLKIKRDMRKLIKQLKPHPVVIVGTLILLAGVIIYSVTVKRNVEVQIVDYFIFKASD